MIFNGCSSILYNEQWKTIEIGEYLFDFPQGFKLVKLQGFDSYVGRIEDDEMSFEFEIGLYYIRLADTPAEYLEKGLWKDRSLVFQGKLNREEMERIEVLNIRPATNQDKILRKNCDYVAKCKLDSIVFEYEICLPPETKGENFIVDTLDNRYRKIIYAKEPENGPTGIYIKNFKNSAALRMTTTGITIQQQNTALKILKSVRLKK